MPFQPTDFAVNQYRIALREGYLYIGAENDAANAAAVGMTSGGITISLNPDYVNIEVDQLHSPLDMIPGSIGGTIETRLVELSIWHLALALGLPKDAVAGSSVLKVYYSYLAKLNNFHSVKVETLRPMTASDDATGGGVRTFEFPRVKVTSPGEFYAMSRSDPTTLPVTIQILGYWNETDSEEIFFEVKDDDDWSYISFWG